MTQGSGERIFTPLQSMFHHLLQPIVSRLGQLDDALDSGKGRFVNRLGWSSPLTRALLHTRTLIEFDHCRLPAAILKEVLLTFGAPWHMLTAKHTPNVAIFLQLAAGRGNGLAARHVARELRRLLKARGCAEVRQRATTWLTNGTRRAGRRREAAGDGCESDPRLCNAAEAGRPRRPARGCRGAARCAAVAGGTLKMSARYAARVLGISHQRVHQLAHEGSSR